MTLSARLAAVGLARIVPARIGAPWSRLAAGALMGLIALVAPLPVPAHADEARGPALWAVTDEDSTIYLFGTVHLLRPETRWRTPRIEAALAESSELWLELADVDDQTAAVPLIHRYGMNFEGPALSSLLTGDENAQLAAAAAAIGVPAAAFEVMRPWLAGVQLTMAAAVKAGYDPASGVDTRLKAAAEEAGLPVRGLETMEQQFRFFHDLSEEAQLGFLRQSLATWEDATEILDGMVGVWAAGDMAAFDRLVVEQMREQWGALYDVLLVRRNADWADQIEAMLEGEGVVFVAVGAAHLAGDDSVQAMLRARGVTVTPR